MFEQTYVDSYVAEEDEKLPIVKFDKFLFEIVRYYLGQANKGFEEWEIDFIHNSFKQLENGEYYLYYFNDYDNRVGGGEGAASIHKSKLRQIIV
jgi:hypothetical protein